ncbi:MAG: hypothetical protein ACK511_13280 [Burkholderiales bacterium]
MNRFGTDLMVMHSSADAPNDWSVWLAHCGAAYVRIGNGLSRLGQWDIRQTLARRR